MSRRRKGHPIGCGHCEMVTFYRLERATQLALKETVEMRDEEIDVIHFKRWLINLGKENQQVT